MMLNLKNDVFGGVTAAVVALPLALAFGMASGAGPMPGLYGAIVVGLFASLFGGTPSQISGPTGPMTVVMTAVFINLKALDPVNGMSLAFTVVILSGAFQILFSFLKLGKYFTLVKYPIISGFMTGIGFIIILLQLGPLLGHSSYPSPAENLLHINDLISTINITSLFIGLCSLLLIFTWKGVLNKIFPASLLALITGTLLSILVFPDSNIIKIGDISSTLPSIYWPILSLSSIKTVFSSALLLAILGSIDSLLGSLVADNLTNHHHNSDKELLGQGIGNLFSGFIGGLPGAGATMRTIVNIRAGGRTIVSGVIHSLTLLIVVLGAGSLFSNIPHAVLAGILIKVGFDIIDWPYIMKLHKIPVFNSFLMLIVFFLTVFVDLITAVFVGVFIANIVTIERLSKIQLDNVLLSDGFSLPERLSLFEKNQLTQFKGSVLLFRITGPMSFGVVRDMRKRIMDFKCHNFIIIDLSDISLVGITTAIVLEDIIKNEIEKNHNIYILGDKESLIKLKSMYIISNFHTKFFYNSIKEVFYNIYLKRKENA